MSFSLLNILKFAGRNNRLDFIKTQLIVALFTITMGAISAVLVSHLPVLSRYILIPSIAISLYVIFVNIVKRTKSIFGVDNVFENIKALFMLFSLIIPVVGFISVLFLFFYPPKEVASTVNLQESM
jgi:hypothetical protein